MPAVARNFAQELQTEIAALDLDPALVVGSNFTLGNFLNVGDLGGHFSEEVILAMFEDGFVPQRQGRKPLQERTIRFIYKGSYGQEAVDRCHALWEALEKKLYFNTATFTTAMLRTDKGASVIGADEAGTYLADFVVTFVAKNRTG